MKRLLPLLALLLPACDSGYDRGYDTSVERPAYAGGGPRVLVDQGHHNRHTMRGSYRPFVELLRNDGYEVDALSVGGWRRDEPRCRSGGAVRCRGRSGSPSPRLAWRRWPKAG